MTLVVFQPPVSTVFERNPARLHAVPPQVLAQQVENAEFPYFPEAHRTLTIDEYHHETGRAGFLKDGSSPLLRRRCRRSAAPLC